MDSKESWNQRFQDLKCKMVPGQMRTGNMQGIRTNVHKIRTVCTQIADELIHSEVQAEIIRAYINSDSDIGKLRTKRNNLRTDRC